MRACWIFGFAAAVRLAAAATAAAPMLPADVPPAGTATVLEINGAIGPAMAQYIVQGIGAAQRHGSRIVVLTLDTPGGLDLAMRDIIRAILATPVPVVGYVTPSGARAASAGTYILYASSVAAMAPATNLGAATPVAVGGQAHAGAMERKVVNDAVAYIRGLAEMHGRNADWAEQAVRGGVSLTASAAVSQRVVDLVAPDLPDLLRQIDGRTVRAGGRSVQLATAHLELERLQPDWRTRFLAVITHPTLAYGLLLIGIYGLLLEGYHPGAMLPGVVGTISLLVALFAFQLLSVSWAGLVLVALGAGMIAAEFFLPAYGSVGLGGLIAFVVGSVILFEPGTPGLEGGRALMIVLAVGAALLLAALLLALSRMQRAPPATGAAALIGTTAEVTEGFAGAARVRCGGELWNARARVPLAAGEIVRIVGVEGLTLAVEPVVAETPDSTVQR